MKRRVLVAFVAAVGFGLGVALMGGSAWAWGRLVDDSCGGVSSYFWAEGPARYWYVTTGAGYGSCFMWTTTIDQSLSPVNRAWWYTDPGDPNGYANIQVYLPNQHNTCGVVNYKVYPNGDVGSIYTYAKDQRTLGWTVLVSNLLMYPRDGAKMHLPDDQSCAVNSEISVDAANYTGP